MLERLDGTFPLVAFPEKLQDYIRAARDTLNFPEPYTASVMLLAVAVAIGNTRVLKVKEGWLVKPILFLTLVGEAGANKSHPISFVLKPLERINNAHIDAYNKALADYRKVKDANPSDKPQPRQVLVSDITTESLVQLHRSNPLRLCLRCDELAGWISNFNRYRKGGDEQPWLSIYSGQPLCVNRKTMDDILSVPEPFICVVGSIQPDILTATFSGERQSNGFLPRILQARQDGSTKLLWNDKGFPAKLERYWDTCLRGIMDNCDKEFSVYDTFSDYTFTEEAFFYIMDWQNQWEEALEQEGRPSQVEAFRKIQDYALKFSLILHTMKEAAGETVPSVQIPIETTITATLLAEYFFFTALQSLDAMEEQNPQRYPRNQADFIIALPDKFTTTEAVKKGEEFGLSESTVKRLLQREKGRLFIWLSHGRYEKKQ